MEVYEKSRLISKRSGLSEDEYEIELEPPGVGHKPGGVRKHKKPCLLCLLIVVAVLLLLVIVIVSVAISRRGNSNSAPSIQQEICANPPVLLISLDGLWSGYLKRNYTPFLNSLTTTGVRAEYLRSEFPTETFPNHFSIVTGLHPESHGIVNNKFYDSVLNDTFVFKDTQVQIEDKWWMGEPIWTTAIKNGLKSNVYFWPGSEVEKFRPTVYFSYDKYRNVAYEERIDTVLGWLDQHSDSRPRFMAAYFNEPDISAHKNAGGPNSEAVNAALTRVDDTVKRLFAGLEERGVKDCVNVIIVSDHGMTTYNSSKLVNLKNILPRKVPYAAVIYGVRADIFVPQGANYDDILNRTYNSLVLNGTGSGKAFRAYHREHLPLRLHSGYHNRQRYGDIYLIADEGGFLSKDGSGIKQASGIHGYDNILTDMQATFIAHGPAFEKSYVSKPFANIELYNLMCDLLSISPSHNNGTVGSLHHLLTPSLLPSLPPPQTLHTRELEEAKGVIKSCPFPTDQETYNTRSFCEECVCWDECTDVSNDTINAANQLLNLTADKIKEYQNLHLPWGVPSGGEGSSSCLLTQEDYITLYSNALHIPLWTAFKLNNTQGALESVGSCLRRDPRVPPQDSSNCTDYSPGGTEEEEEGFVPVSLAAAAFSNSSTQPQQLNANLLSSVVPQFETFNTGVWLPLNELLRSWASSSTIHVFLGSVLDTNRDGRRDKDADYTWWVDGEVGGVAIPTHFYAVVVRCLDSGMEPADCELNQLDTAGLLFQHPTELGDPSPVLKLLRFSLTQIRDIERVTGVDFFPNLTPQQQNTLELKITNELWSV